ncbi:MAG: 50S ribosomal protein L15 [Enterobacteriaceae bacterium]|nr:50S ribosomal protein L15 [Enterobacteriaceae bacterium]
MYLNKFKVRLKKRIRVGRGIGSGLGKTCGKGHKGHKARSGYSAKSCFEGGQTPLDMRLPKFGFFSRKSRFSGEIQSAVLNKFSDVDIDLNFLKKYKLVNNNVKIVKVVYSGDINRAINLNGLKVTNKVRVNIELLGGTVCF